MNLKILIAYLSIIFCISCNKNTEMPIVGFNEFEKEINNVGVPVKNLKQSEFLIFNDSDIIFKLKPQTFESKEEVSLNYKLYHLRSEKESTFISMTDELILIDSFRYNHKLKPIFLIHDNQNGKVRMVSEDKIFERDSLNSMLQPFEINEEGKFSKKEKFVSYMRYVETRPKSNSMCGVYKGTNNNVKCKLTLKDGNTNNKYCGLLEVNPPESCIVVYNIIDEDIISTKLSFDDNGKFNLYLKDQNFIIENLGQEICEEGTSKFKMNLSKE